MPFDASFIKSDNGSEFVGKVMDKWVCEQAIAIAMDLSRPGKPTDNAMLESFYGKLRQGFKPEPVP